METGLAYWKFDCVIDGAYGYVHWPMLHCSHWSIFYIFDSIDFTNLV